ncbi:MAG: hypothetical protein ACOYM3_06550 [Terrimicrobiaceae bacterium]
MAATYLILPGKRLIIQRFIGPTGSDEIKQLTLRVRADPLFDRSFHTLMDFTRAVLKIGIAEVSMLCNFIFSLAEGEVGSAVIVASSPMGTALAMLFSKGLSLFTPSAVFSSHEAAFQFLGVDMSDGAHL